MNARRSDAGALAAVQPAPAERPKAASNGGAPAEAAAPPALRPRLTVDLAALAENWRRFDAMGRAETGAAVKADAYGVGVTEAGPALRRAGCRTFFVATASEAATLTKAIRKATQAARRAQQEAQSAGGPKPGGSGAPAKGRAKQAGLGPWPKKPAVYVLNGAIEGLEEILAVGARPVLNTEAEARAADAEGRRREAPIACAIQVETGMNRLGMQPSEQAWLLANQTRGLAPDLIMSHLACADAPEHPANDQQRASFRAAREELKLRFPSARASLAATGGALLGQDFAFDLIRPGVGLYGGAPFLDAASVVTLEAPLMRIWSVRAGETSGYGGVWRAERPSRLATVPLGYADGLPRALSNRGRARVGGVEVPVAGRISMDLTVLDITDVEEVSGRAPSIGDFAVFLDDTLTVDRMAAQADTIGYEILTRLGSRAERRYVG